MNQKMHKIMNEAMKRTNKMVAVTNGAQYYHEHERALRENLVKVTLEMAALEAQKAVLQKGSLKDAVMSLV